MLLVGEDRAVGDQDAVGGDALAETAGPGSSEAIGIVIALMVLAITFGSLVAAGMPLLTAIIGVVIGVTGWRYVDTVIAVAIGLFILPRTYRLMQQALRIIMEVAPPGIDVTAATRDLAGIAGVREVHDLHIWTITSGMEAATVHLVVDDDVDWHSVLDQSRDLLSSRYAVTHPTIQLEPADHVEVPVGF